MGMLRVALALAVIGAHTKHPFLVGGRQAVIIFYLISGFLIARAINEVYRDNIGSFYLNRWLRIFVPALVVLVVASLIRKMAGMPITQFASASPGVQTYSLLANTLIVFQDFAWLFAQAPDGSIVWQPYGTTGNATSLRVYQYNLPMFTVAIEIYFYAIAPFVLRSVNRTLMFLAVGGIYHLILIYLGAHNLAFNYHFFMASWMYFACGAGVYWLSSGKISGLHASVAFAGIVISAAMQSSFSSTGLSLWMFLACAFGLPALMAFASKVPFDRYLGNYSYLLYLVHFPIVKVVAAYAPHLGSERFYLVAAISMSLAAILHHFVDVPLERIRADVRAARFARPRIGALGRSIST